MDLFANALMSVLSPSSFFLLIGGVGLGIIFGAIPGLTATMAVALLVPFTYSMAPAQGIVALVGVYVGGIYGGSISACLVNIPGTPASMLTTIDGYPMGQRGEAGKAIGYATVSSFVGGIVSGIILIVFAGQVAKIAYKFGPAEYFSIAFFGLSLICAVSGGNLLKGLISAIIGLMIKCVGMDPVTSVSRYVFGYTSLLGGFTFIPVMIGLFGMREFLIQVSTGRYRFQVEQRVGKILPSLKELLHEKWIMLRSGLIGTFIGILPGAGGPIAAFLSYECTRRLSKHPETFGKGEPDGLCSSEAANNGVTGGAIIPMLTLGVPGDSVTAIMLGAFMVHNITPGPNLFTNSPDLIYAIYLGFIIANVLMLIYGLFGAKVFAKILNVPMGILLPCVAVLTVIGGYSIRNSLFDVRLVVLFGLLGYVMSCFDFPIVPMVLGLVLGQLCEANLRSALVISKGSWWIFFEHPIACVFTVLGLIMLISPLIAKILVKAVDRKKNS